MKANISFISLGCDKNLVDSEVMLGLTKKAGFNIVPDEADADIIVTAVSCQSPLLKADAIKKGAYYCHVGGWEDEYEVPLKADKIVCDNWESLKHRGSPTIAKLYNQGFLKDEDIYSNIADIILGNKVGRESDQEFIYFNAIGLAFVDIALAYSFYKTVEANKLGELWSMR